MKIKTMLIVLGLMFLFSGCKIQPEEKYTITFNTNGGTAVETIQISPGDVVTLPATSKNNFTFKGWYYSQSQQEVKVHSLNNIDKDQTLYAKWEFVVSFYDHKGQLIRTQVYDEAADEQLPSEVMEGYRFAGWVTSGLERIDRTGLLIGHTNLYQTWSYLIAFESNYEIDVTEIEVLLGTSQSLPTIEREYYVFLGWYLDDAEEEKQVTNSIDIEGSNLVYAKWKLSDSYISNFILETIDNSYIIQGTYEEVEKLIIPSSIHGKNVVSIADQAFFEQTTLKHIIFEENSKLSSIGGQAFYNTGIMSLEMPESLTEVKYEAFMGSLGLVEVSFSSNLLILEKDAFKDTSWYKQLNNTMIIINEILFLYKGSETSITIPSEVELINDFAFDGNTSLKTILFHEFSSISTFTANTFFGTKVETIYVPDSLTMIEERAFSNHLYIKTLVFSELSTLEVIGDRAFEKSGLIEANFPDTVTQVGIDAFAQTAWLADYPSDFVMIADILVRYKAHVTTVTIPNNVKIIGAKAFGFNFIKNVIISNSVERIEEQAFIGTHLDSVSFEEGSKLTYIGENAFINNYVKGNITLPSSLLEIDEGAFYNCLNLTSITLQSKTPPMIGDIFNNNYLTKVKIYVPIELVDGYKLDSNWAKYESIIHPVA